MLNPIEFYADLGRRAGRAMRTGDTGLYQSLARQHVDANNAELTRDREPARRAYKAAYTAAFWEGK